MTTTLRTALSDPHALRVRLTDLAIDSHTVWVPDAILERQAREPAHFALRLTANRVTFFSARGCGGSREVTSEERAWLVEAAIGALRAGDVEPREDTAVGRYVTTLSIDARWPGVAGDEELPIRGALVINHYAHGGCSAHAWLRLIEGVERLLGELASSADRAHLAFLRAHFSARR